MESRFIDLSCPKCKKPLKMCKCSVEICGTCGNVKCSCLVIKSQPVAPSQNVVSPEVAAFLRLLAVFLGAKK